MFVKR